MDLCGETSNTQGKVTIKNLNPNITYYFKLEAFGGQPFMVQGYFTTMPLMGMHILYVGIHNYT